MKVKREYIFLAATVAVLSAYLLMRRSSNMHYSLPELKKIDKKDITKLVIKKADSEVTLLKKGDKWVISPQNFPANNEMASRMEDGICSLTITDLVSESRNDVLYDLNKEKKIEVSAYKGDQVLRKVEVGKLASSYRHTFLKVDSDSRVFHAQGDLTNTFNKTASDIRDKTVMAFKGEEITEMLVNKGGKKVSMSKKAGKWETDKGKSANEEEVGEIIRSLSDLACDSFIEGKTKNDFKNPVFSISLSLGGVKEYSISLFEKKDNKYSAISSETEYPFYISEYSAERFMKELETLAAQFGEGAP